MPIFHVRYPHFKHEENSLRGAVYADRHGYNKIDWDLQMTKDRVIVVTHWRRPMRRDGFRDPRRILDPDTPIGQLTWRQVKRLVTHDGYRIRRIEPMLRFAGRIGIRPVLEPKSKRFAVDWPWEHIAQVANEAGAHIEAYALRSHGGVETMAAAARHGVPARVIYR